MSTPVDQIWDTQAPAAAAADVAPESVTETPAAPAAAAATDAEAVADVPTVKTDATPAPADETLTPAEVKESPAAEPDKPSDEPKAEASDAAERTVDPNDAKLPPEVRGRLRKGQEAIEAHKQVEPLVERVGGLPLLQETVELREKFEAEDLPGFFETLESWSPSKAAEVGRAMIESGLELPEWQQIAAEKYFASKGKTLAEVESMLAGAPATAAADETGDDDPNYDADGNFITPEARRIAKLESELEALKTGTAQTAEEKANAERLRQQAEFAATRDAKFVEFVTQVEQPVQAKIKAANLLPADDDTPELAAIKAEELERITEETARDFFNGKDTKAFADRTLDYFKRGEFEVANKRLETARRAAETIADRHIARSVARIEEHIAAQAHKLTQTTTRTEAVIAAGGAAAPGSHSAPLTTPQTAQNLDDIWAVDEAATRDALARDPWRSGARAS